MSNVKCDATVFFTRILLLQYLDADRLQMMAHKAENDLYMLLNCSESKQVEDLDYVRHFASKSNVKSIPLGNVTEQRPDCVSLGSVCPISNQKNTEQGLVEELNSEDLKWLGRKNVETSKVHQSKLMNSKLGFPPKLIEKSHPLQNVTIKKNPKELHLKAERLLDKIKNQEEILESKLADMSSTSYTVSSVSSLVGLPIHCLSLPGTEQAESVDDKNEIRKEPFSFDPLSNISLPDDGWFNQLLKNELEL